MRGTAILLLAVLLGPAADAAEFSRAVFEDVLPYRLASPADVGTNRFPLVLFLHGRGESGTDNEAQLRHGVREFTRADNFARRPCHVLAPQCPTNSYWGGATLDRVLRLADRLVRELPVDPDRVYVTGLSMGGYGTWEALARYPDRWAAAIPVCGGGNPLSTVEMVRIPVWAFHGDADPVVPAANTRTMVERLRRNGGSVRYTEYPGVGHDAWTRTYADPVVMVWLFSARRGQPAPPGP